MMGTLADVVAYPESETARQASVGGFGRMDEVEGLAHRQRVDAPASLKGELAAILGTGLEVSRASSGAFDPTLGEVIALWGFDSEKPHLPEPDDLSDALGRAGYRRLDPAVPGSVSPFGNSPPIWLDLGGVAKGYAVDEAVKSLRGRGVSGGIVNAGGDLRTFGSKPGGKPWKIGVQDPDHPQELAGVLTLREAAVATSGDYQRYFEEGGVRYHHILDPATGYPARSGLRGTTVIAPDCALADALATAAFVLGPEKGLKLLEEWDGVEGVLITDGGEILTTSGIGKSIPFEKR
ncbi:MAG: FAD:protein FMN transferase [bacterium]|nr:FAD:protein FMN transferase [bacterium]